MGTSPYLPQKGFIMYVEIRRVVWMLTGLHAYLVCLCTVDTETGEVHTKEIDYHWQESVARMCAERWSTFYNLPIKAI